MNLAFNVVSKAIVLYRHLNRMSIFHRISDAQIELPSYLDHVSPYYNRLLSLYYTQTNVLYMCVK